MRPVSRRLKNKTVHTTFELWQAALQDPILLPIVNKYPSGLFANTDSYDKPGMQGQKDRTKEAKGQKRPTGYA